MLKNILFYVLLVNHDLHLCKERIISVSFKDVTAPKLGLTMIQVGLGRIDWIEDEGKQAD